LAVCKGFAVLAIKRHQSCEGRVVRLIYAMLIGFALPASCAAGVTAAVEEIPFKFRDGFIWIEVTVPIARQPLNFLLDSGAEVSVINASTAGGLGMGGGVAVSVMGVGSATTGYWPQRMEARAGGVELPRKYLTLDLSKLGEACTNAKVDGIIGADFFQDRIVQLDYRQKMVRLLREATMEPGVQVLPLKVRHCGMLVPVCVNGSKLQWVRLDTGCASSLQWVTGSIRPEQCTPRVAVALTTMSIPTTQTTVALGGIRFEGVPTDVQREEVFPGEKGLLGNGLLSRFGSVTIDGKRKEVVLGPVLAVGAAR
jgi:hypothetical protein